MCLLSLWAAQGARLLQFQPCVAQSSGMLVAQRPCPHVTTLPQGSSSRFTPGWLSQPQSQGAWLEQRSCNSTSCWGFCGCRKADGARRKVCRSISAAMPGRCTNAHCCTGASAVSAVIQATLQAWELWDRAVGGVGGWEQDAEHGPAMSPAEFLEFLHRGWLSLSGPRSTRTTEPLPRAHSPAGHPTQPAQGMGPPHQWLQDCKCSAAGQERGLRAGAAHTGWAQEVCVHPNPTCGAGAGLTAAPQLAPVCLSTAAGLGAGVPICWDAWMCWYDAYQGQASWVLLCHPQ